MVINECSSNGDTKLANLFLSSFPSTDICGQTWFTMASMVLEEM